MRKLLLLAALSMVAALLFAPAALAQTAGPAYDFIEVPNGTPACPIGLEQVEEIYGPTVTCGEGGGYVPIVSTSTATPTATPSATPAASAQYDQYKTATPTATATVLPETGGAAPSLSLEASLVLALIVGGGILSAFVLRRS